MFLQEETRRRKIKEDKNEKVRLSVNRTILMIELLDLEYWYV